MTGTQPDSTYLGPLSSSPAGIPARLPPFQPSPGRTTNPARLYNALNNSTLISPEQNATPYQFGMVLSLINSPTNLALYNNSNANLTYAANLDNTGKISFSVTDMNGTSTIATTQALQVGWSYALTFQYTYQGQIGQNRSAFMFIYINGRMAATTVSSDGLASISVAKAASTLTAVSGANTYIAAISQWYYAAWASYYVTFAYQWWYYWWYSWWYSYWWYWWYYWWYLSVNYCTVNDCGPNDCHAAAPFDKLYHFETFTGNVEFVLAGVGIRDFDTNITPAVITITIPGPVIKAYLYWNTITGGGVCPDIAIFDGHTVGEGIIGCCGNTCWSAFSNSSGSEFISTGQNLLNKVWFADVTPFVPGSGSYTVSIPNIFPNPEIAFEASDSPHYPGCNGGQGIALLVIYETPSQIIVRPHKHCCVPVGTQTVTESTTRQVIIYHGAKLLVNADPMPPTIGGSQSYTISFYTQYTWNPKLANGVGDAQTAYSDSFYWNGTELPPEPSYFNPYAGNLLHIKTEFLPGGSAVCNCGGGGGQPNIVTAFTPDDCLSWFLFVYSGGLKCVTPIITPKSQSFTSNCAPPLRIAPPLQILELAPTKPLKLKVNITGFNETYTMDWYDIENKYILTNQAAGGCNLFGWLYCVGTAWTLYLALVSTVNPNDVCSDGINVDFPIQKEPFGGTGVVMLSPTGTCSCDASLATLVVTISGE